jgi:hypothetical protein
MQAMHIYQFLNHYTRREELDPGFGVLDNSSNPRPDWKIAYATVRVLKSYWQNGR